VVAAARADGDGRIVVNIQAVSGGGPVTFGEGGRRLTNLEKSETDIET